MTLLPLYETPVGLLTLLALVLAVGALVLTPFVPWLRNNSRLAFGLAMVLFGLALVGMLWLHNWELVARTWHLVVG
jgi:hypothetical protein